jgi:hypothetical protein
MAEWLKAFYIHIRTIRQVLLTIDNFKPHIIALELTPPSSNIRVC